MNDKKLLRQALAHHKRGAFTEALKLYHELFQRHPTDDIGDHCAYYGGLAAYQCRSLAPADFTVAWAISLLETAVRRCPTDPKIWMNLGHMNQEAGRAANARDCYRRALKIDPTLLEAQVQLGNAYLDLGLPMRAGWCFDLAKQMIPTTDEAHYHRGLACLLTGDWAEGWHEYEHRWALAAWLTEHATPELRGKAQGASGRLLVHCEQGAGDTIMASRWIPQMRDRVTSLTLRVQPGMGQLFRGQFEGVEVVEFGQEVGAFDHWIASMSLPYLFDVKHPDAIPGEPYLRSPGTFRELPGAFRVGIVWAGTAKHKNDARRSTALADWTPVLRTPCVTFYSLQVGERSAELAPWSPWVTDLSGELTDWQVTAAALTKVDLLVTVDTGIAHLAGALGVPTWIALASAPDWRWGLGDHRTPWYHGVRLFRQPKVGEWGSVFTEIARVLRGAAATKEAA